MNKRFAGVFVFALVVAAVASFLVYRYLGQSLARYGEQRPSTELLVAARALNSGEMIREMDLKTEKWTQPIPRTAINDKQKLLSRGVLYPIVAGEPILEERLAPEGAGAGLPALIPAGMRALAVPVNNVSGVSGFVTPGTRVDILVMGNPPNAPQSLGTLSKTLLQNIEVLSAGTQVQRDGEGKPVQVPVINLLCTPEQAEVISLASSNARIQLVLRNPLDKEEAKTGGTAFSRLFTDQKGFSLQPTASVRPKAAPKAPTPAPPPLYVEKRRPDAVVVEILTGAKKYESKFEQADHAQPEAR